VPEWSFSQGERPLVVAHRGASAEVDENTLAAFDLAVALGADAVEFDVRVTGDGVPVVHHDPTGGRTSDGEGPIRDRTLAEIKRWRTPAGHEIPTLDEVLTLLSGRVAIDIEIKNLPGEPDFEPDRQRVLEATLEALDASAFVGPVLLSSFNPAALAHARSVRPEITTGLLTEFQTEAVDALARAAEAGHPWVLPFSGMVATADDGFVDAVHDAGLLLGTWIADVPSFAVDLWRRGVDAVATNDPRAIVAARREAFGA
jgi:glycerophosphoryl diester phosphodiesterase